MTDLDKEELLETTRLIVSTSLDVQREVFAENPDLDQIDELRDQLERLWYDLNDFDLQFTASEPRKRDPFPESSETIRLTTPFPPTLNHNVGYCGKRRYRDKNYDAFIELVGYEWRRVRPRIWDAERRFAIDIRLFYNSKRRYDVDNRVKPILDALTKAGAWTDDSQVDDVRVVRCGLDKANPRSEIAIIPLDVKEEPAKPKRKRRQQ